MLYCRTLDLILISAKGLKDANIINKMDVYAVVSISGLVEGPPVIKGGGTNPTWNFPMEFIFDEAAALENRRTLIVKIKAVGMFMNTKLGEVHVPIKELLETQGNAMQLVSFPVIRKRSGKQKGDLNFSYKFGEKFSIREDPVQKHRQRSPKKSAVPKSYPVSCGSSVCGGGCG
ncbi:hypothetical protein L6452_25613 [Arctium lappa]|uniref:Uncharacterized protein n=1 Tax=Arctium lappa TaxID=4217 RepID=A0ACB9AFQ4_ARCLA|nr:hypothetical protein L6452_25613 [Arctium lappa]